jgi:hypothetical protein
MTLLQQVIIFSYGLLSLLFFLKGYYEVTKKKNVFGLTNHLVFLGAFVWGDIIVLGPFWILISTVTILLNDWYLFLLILSVFWVVRSLGETIYWLNEQFATKNRNPANTLRFYKIFKNDSVWFVYQLINQCILVVSIIFSIYFAKLWLSS